MATAISPARAALDRATEGRTTIPFDYAFRFELEGDRGSAHRRQIRPSVEGEFVAVSIGYGFVPAIAEKRFPLVVSRGVAFTATTPVTFSNITLEDVLLSIRAAYGGVPSSSSRERIAAAFRSGIRINPEIIERALMPGASLDADTIRSLFELAGTPGEVQFLYALSDPGTGREFQSEPLLSTAGLGSADGERPFRQFPMPIRFEPQSTIQMEVTEVDRQPGTLHVVLHGYRVLGAPAPVSGSNAAVARRRRRG